jgi:hypothetical protein
MDKNTFPDETVAQVLNSKYIPVKMEMETGYGKTLSMKYHVSGFPTFLVFNHEGQLTGRMMGYLKPEEFLASLEKATMGSVVAGLSSNIELPYPDFYKNNFGKKGEKKNPDVTTVEAHLDAQKDLSSEINWAVLYRFGYMTRKYDNYVLDNKIKLSELYGQTEVDGFIRTIINSEFSKAVKEKDEQMLRNNVFALVKKHLEADAIQIMDNYELSFYTRTADYAKMMSSLTRQIEQYGSEDYGSAINSACWTIYEKSDDPQIITQAVAHMKKVVDKEPMYAYLDTYAALLYKNKQYKEGEQYALQAIEEGRKANQNVKETEELLEKIRAGAGSK